MCAGAFVSSCCCAQNYSLILIISLFILNYLFLIIYYSLLFIRPNNKTFHAPKPDFHPLPKVGEVVMFTYENSTVNQLPVKPKVYRVRTDVSWGDVVRKAAQDREQKQFNGTSPAHHPLPPPSPPLPRVFTHLLHFTFQTIPKEFFGCLPVTGQAIKEKTRDSSWKILPKKRNLILWWRVIGTLFLQLASFKKCR
jgi:hypothetical protein